MKKDVLVLSTLGSIHGNISLLNQEAYFDVRDRLRFALEDLRKGDTRSWPVLYKEIH